MKAWFIFSWEHFYIGLRWYPRLRQLRIFILPFVGLKIDLNGKRDDLQKSAVALAYTTTVFVFLTYVLLLRS